MFWNARLHTHTQKAMPSTTVEFERGEMRLPREKKKGFDEIFFFTIPTLLPTIPKEKKFFRRSQTSILLELPCCEAF